MNNDGFEQALQSFKKDFVKIKGHEVKSNRKHNTGIGKTFEDIIGVVENNNLLIDYKGHIELKSQRQYSGSMVTLFTKSPDNPKSAMSYISDKYGTPDVIYSDVNIIHTTVSYNKFNSYKDTYGFKLDINDNEEKLKLQVKDLKTNKIIDDNIYWKLDTIKNIVETKCKNIAYVTAKSRKENQQEYFTFTKAVLLSGMTFAKFLQAIKEDIIFFDIRCGVYRTGKNKGKRHDHGAAFRIPKHKISDIFTVEEI